MLGRMIRTLFFSFLAVCILGLTGCETNPQEPQAVAGETGAETGSGPNEPRREPSSQTIGLASNGETLNIHVGDTISVALPQNASTGYTWVHKNVFHGVMKQHGSKTTSNFEPGTNVGTLVGQPSVETWTYVAVKPGTATIRMEYMRPWEKDTEPSNTFEVTVNVTE